MYRASRTRLMCRSCQYQGTVTSGTIFDKTRTPLRVWLAAAWYLTNQKQGVSALGCSAYWVWELPDRLDHAAPVSTCHGPPGRDKLKGLVEVDETYLSITDRKNPATLQGARAAPPKC